MGHGSCVQPAGDRSDQEGAGARLHTVMGMEMLVNQVSAICKFILDWEAPEEAKKIGIDFYCNLFNYHK